MVPENTLHVEEAGVRRRWHPRDVPSLKECGAGQREAPSVHNSLAIRRKHVASMYRSVYALALNLEVFLLDLYRIHQVEVCVLFRGRGACPRLHVNFSTFAANFPSDENPTSKTVLYRA